MNYPFLSIVIPVRNEEKHIAGLLKQLLEQDYPPGRLEILVIEGGSQDRTREIVNDFCRKHGIIRLLDNPQLLSSSARNIGAGQAKGEVIVYVDGHCQIPNQQLLKNISTVLEKSGADCLGRAQPLIGGEKKITRAISIARSSVLGHNPDSYIYSDLEGLVDPTSCGAAYRKEVFQKVGLFDETFDACEDVEFNLRVKQAGLKCYLSPALTIQYFPRESISALFKQMFRYGWGRYKLFRKHPSVFPRLTCLPGLYLLLLLLLLVAGLFNSLFLKLFLVAVLLYLAPVALFSLWLALSKGVQLFPLFLLIFPAIHFGISLGFWSTLLGSRKRG